MSSDKWTEVKLDEVVEITSSKRIFLSDYVPEGVPFFRSKEIIERFNGKAISGTERLIHVMICGLVKRSSLIVRGLSIRFCAIAGVRC